MKREKSEEKIILKEDNSKQTNKKKIYKIKTVKTIEKIEKKQKNEQNTKRSIKENIELNDTEKNKNLNEISQRSKNSENSENSEIKKLKISPKEKNEKDKKMQINTLSETQTKEIVIEKTQSKWQKKVSKFLNSTPILSFTTILTIWALFSNDILYSFLPKKFDEPFNIIQCIILFIFTLEFILNCLSKENYLFTFFYYLDFISTISLIQDIDYVMNPFMGYSPITEDKISRNGKRKSYQAAKAISKVSTASRATRVLRVIRIVRLIRMVKLYKSVLIAKEKRELLKMEKKKKLMEKLERELDDSSSSKNEGIDRINSINFNSNSNMNSNNINTNNVNSNYIGNESDSNIKNGMTSTIIKIKRMSRISRKSLYMNKSVESSNGLLLMQSGNLLKNTRLSDNIFNSNIHDKNNINFNAQSIINNEQNNNINNNEENKNDNNLDDKNKQKEKEKEKENKEDEESEENIIKESKISKLVTESLTKKVIILILILLVFFPLLNDDFWNSDSIITYDFIAQILSLHYAMFQTRGIKNNQIDITKLYDSKFPPVNITINGIIYYLNDNFNNFDFRYRELSTVYSDDAMVRIVYSIRKESKLTALLNLFQTIFVCFALTISSILFENDAENLVLKPLEIMIEIVDKVAKDPIGAKNIEELQEGIKAEMETIKQSSDKEENKLKFNILKNKNINNINIINSNNINNNININININNDNLNNSLNNNLNNNNYININNNNNIVNTSNKKLTLITNKEEDENYEVSVIKSAIIKISALLAIGFGDAGGEIIKKNLSYNQSLNPL